MLSLFSDDMRRNPFPAYAQLRAASPVLYDPQTNLWLIFDYEGVKRVLSDHDVFASNLFESIGRPTPEWMIFFDPPRHSKLRELIMRAFTPRVVSSLEPRIREISRALLDRVVKQGAMDLAGDFAVPLPMMVIAEMIGIPPSDWERFRRWSDAILKLSYTISDRVADSGASAEYKAATSEMREALPPLIEERKSRAREDLLTGLVAAEVDGEKLSETEILGFVQLLLVAGNETTANLINNAILCFTENAGVPARIAADPSLLPAAIEEVLRFRSPLQFSFRGVRREAQFPSAVIPAGALVLPMIGSANRDPSQFPDPDRFDILRDPNRHLAFGHGIHFCIGALLSRLEARIALGDLIVRAPDLRLASAEPWEPRHALHVYGPSRLPIEFTPE